MPAESHWVAFGHSPVLDLSLSIRRCRTSEFEFKVRPLLFGRSFAFDKRRQVVTIKWEAFGISVRPEEFPFSDIGIKYEIKEYPGLDRGEGLTPPDAAYFRLLLNLPDGRILTVTMEGETKFNSRVRKTMRYLGLNRSTR